MGKPDRWYTVEQEISFPAREYYLNTVHVSACPHKKIKTPTNLWECILALSELIKGTMGVGYFVTDPPGWP